METIWETLSFPPALSGAELCVFKAEWTSVREFTTTFERWLAPGESARVAGTSHLRVRERFVLSRGILRLLLGRYIRCDPARVDIVLEASGRPILGPSHGPGGLRWSLAHSHEAVVVALSHHLRVGIDLEYLGRPMHASEVAHRFFHANEATRLDTLPEDGRTEAFFHYWTAKEAVLKATGLGLSGALDRCVVEYQPGAASAIVHCAENDHVSPWHVAYLGPYPQYLAAISAEGREWTYRCVDASRAFLNALIEGHMGHDGPVPESRRPRKND
ncbi:4'-phosphopantetheinyl transferase [Nitrospira sp.]|nr:4'-phosphopantetheinyl transferase [Nitrospira sp.]